MQSAMMLSAATCPAVACQVTGARRNAFKTGALPKRAMQLSSGESAFAGRAVAARQARQHARQSVAAQAMIRQYPDPDYIELVKSEFPDKGIANTEEARILFTEAGYTYLDVRPKLEYEDAGKVTGSVNIPIVNKKWVYDPVANRKSIHREDNANFVADVEKRFKNKDQPLLIGCSTGSKYSIDALEALDEAGYTCIVGIRGGYYAWQDRWDNKMRRRTNGEAVEVYSADGDSCGIHSSGAGFERVDVIGKVQWPSYE